MGFQAQLVAMQRRELQNNAMQGRDGEREMENRRRKKLGNDCHHAQLEEHYKVMVHGVAKVGRKRRSAERDGEVN